MKGKEENEHMCIFLHTYPHVDSFYWPCLGLDKRGIYKYKEEDYKMGLSQLSAGSIIACKKGMLRKNSSSNLVVVGKEDPCQRHHSSIKHACMLDELNSEFTFTYVLLNWLYD